MPILFGLTGLQWLVGLVIILVLTLLKVQRARTHWEWDNSLSDETFRFWMEREFRKESQK